MKLRNFLGRVSAAAVAPKQVGESWTEATLYTELNVSSWRYFPFLFFSFAVFRIVLSNWRRRRWFGGGGGGGVAGGRGGGKQR